MEPKIWPKNELTLQNRNRLTDIGKRRVAAGGGGERGGGVWDWQMKSIMCEMDKQQSPAAEHRGLYPVP